jgi:hypothetical protein
LSLQKITNITSFVSERLHDLYVQCKATKLRVASVWISGRRYYAFLDKCDGFVGYDGLESFDSGFFVTKTTEYQIHTKFRLSGNRRNSRIYWKTVRILCRAAILMEMEIICWPSKNHTSTYFMFENNKFAFSEKLSSSEYEQNYEWDSLVRHLC